MRIAGIILNRVVVHFHWIIFFWRSFPMNLAAQNLCAQQWLGGSAIGPYHCLPYTDLKVCTDNFSSELCIGTGGSCEVYRGILYGVPVAIKALKPKPKVNEATDSATQIVEKIADESSTRQGVEDWDDKQLQAELAVLTAIRHQNICRLYAWSFDGRRRRLVLESMAGGSVDARLALRNVTGGTSLDSGSGGPSVKDSNRRVRVYEPTSGRSKAGLEF